MRNFIPFQFPFASNEHKSFFEYAMHEIGSTYPNVIAAVYLLSACPETRDNIWEMIDLDGSFKDDFWEFWENDDSRRCVALAVNFLCGGYYPVLSPSYLYDTPLAPILWAAMEFWYHNKGIPQFCTKRRAKSSKNRLAFRPFLHYVGQFKTLFLQKEITIMSKIAYVRVSTQEQNEARQREALATRGIDKWFIEKTSGKNTDRPEFQRMMDWIREGDTIYIHDLSRIARSTLDLLHLLNTLAAKGVSLVSDKENIDTNTATGKLIITVIAAINEFERANLLERQREGIAIAKREGKYKGRQPVTIPDLPRHYDRYIHREISKVALARELGISRPTLDRLFAEYEQQRGGKQD